MKTRKILKNQDGSRPNNLIDISLKDMIRLKSKLGKNMFRHVADILSVDRHPNILMAAMEFGTLKIKGETVTAKVGGLAVVINDMIMNYPKFLSSRSRGHISFAFMAYDGIPQCDYVKSFSYWIGARYETVDIYKYEYESGATLYFVDHPLFKRRTIRDNNRNLYNPYPGEMYSGRPEWEEAFALALFNRAVASIGFMLDINIYHAHDYHTGLAAMYLPNNIVKAMTIHNAGPGYQGTFWTKNFGATRVPKLGYPFGIPTGDSASNDYLLSILGVNFETYMKYFEQNGQFNCLKAISAIEDENLIAAMPVSAGYARELKMAPEEIFNDIHLQKGHGALDGSKVYIPNGGMRLGLLKGVENGLSDAVHAKNHIFLQKKTADQLKNIHPAIFCEEDKRRWLEGLNFGADLESEEGIAQVHKTKAILKEMLQRNAGLEVNPDKPVFVLISRMVAQKNVAILAHNIEHIVANGGQVVVGGLAGDDEGWAAASHIIHLETLPHLKGQIKYYNEFTNKELGVLIQAGGDFFVITSKFEPCGLTDIEAAWLGTIPLCRKTGGLGKVQNGLYYLWNDSSDSWGEVMCCRAAIDRAINIFKNKHDRFLKMRIGGMKENFSWHKALSKYYEYYRTSACYKFVKELNHQVDCGLNPYLAKDKLKTVFENFPQDMVIHFQSILSEKRHLSPFMRMVVKTDFYPEITKLDTSRTSVTRKVFQLS